ncbi:hypothetical protein AGMMS50276_18530 [Synergistales bacterium]|nr:hypothetical protein AGMMS50276_18530 [Synergistales bacterium]
MSVVAPFLELASWRNMENTLKMGDFPHCWATRAPLDWHLPLLEAMARLIFCDTGTACGHCGGCLGWSDDVHHPDLTVVGEFDKAGNIGACRDMARELSMKPVCAHRRLGVVLAADKLLVHAANSLLKIAEEPPGHAVILFIMDGDGLLPTLKSRSNYLVFHDAGEASGRQTNNGRPRVAPTSETEWLSWLEKALLSKDEMDLPSMLSSWNKDPSKNPEFAIKLEKLRLLISQKKLSQNMACDILILTLKEDIPFEHIFSGVW